MMQRVAIIGLGLIGGSLALGLKRSGFSQQVVGYDHSEAELAEALKLGLINEAADSAEDAVSQADMVVLAVPVKAMGAVLEQIQPALNPEQIITDVGSVKGAVVEVIKGVLGHVPQGLVPGHPIAGSERSGVHAARGDLFKAHKVILTPLPETASSALRAVRAMWEGLGATVLEMEVAHHDDVLAATSHLPHLIAFSLVDTLAGEEDNREIFLYAAGGFRDFTRIAASDPTMWHDIFLTNKAALLNRLQHFTDDLAQLKNAIEAEDSTRLLGVFTRAKAAREHFSTILSGTAYSPTMNSKDITFLAHKGRALSGDIRVPGDKSISHRSIMLGSLADGVTEVEGFLEGEDSLATLQAFRDMGVVIEGPHQGKVRIFGVGLHGLKAPPGPLYLGNSGTSMRLLTGLLAAQAFDVELTGDESLSKRPMERVAKPLRQMGAVITTGEGGKPPVRIQGGQPLQGTHYAMPMASAQVKSAVLLGGLYASGETSVTEPAPTRDHTERMLAGFGVQVAKDGATTTLTRPARLDAKPIDVPADISSAAFFMVAASITPGSDLTLKHVGINPTRTGVIAILRLMGANISLLNQREVGGEPVADIRVRYVELKGIDIPEDQVPLAIDEFPVLFIAAVCAKGRTRLSGAEELRVKESDRIQVMADGLAELGVTTEVKPDGIVIDGAELGSGTVNSHGDHRIAMAFAVAALRASGPIEILDCANVATSFPGFVTLANGVGMNVQEQANG